MAALVPTDRYVVALGPIKAEIVNFSGTVSTTAGGTQTGVTDADTFESNLANPQFAIGSITSDAVSVAVSFNAALTANSKTVTINTSDLANDNIVVIVFGF